MKKEELIKGIQNNKSKIDNLLNKSKKYDLSTNLVLNELFELLDNVLIYLKQLYESITRDALIEIDKVIDEVEELHPYKKAGDRDSYSEYAEGWSDACDILGERIKEYLKQSKIKIN